MATQLQKMFEQYKVKMSVGVASAEFAEGMMGMIDEIRRNENPADIVTPFFTQAELREIGDFYADKVVMGEIISCSVNRMGKMILEYNGADVYDPRVFAGMMKVKDSIKAIEAKTCAKVMAECVKRYGEPKNVNADKLKEYVERMQTAEAQWERGGNNTTH